MADILHDYFINAAPGAVFRILSEPAGLDAWWTLRCTGDPRLGSEYGLYFGPQFDWRARVRACDADRCFELELTRADGDWLGTRVRFELEAEGGGTRVRFCHLGWPAVNDHFRTSSYCWACYLRVLKRYIERGESVPYDLRLD